MFWSAARPRRSAPGERRARAVHTAQGRGRKAEDPGTRTYLSNGSAAAFLFAPRNLHFVYNNLRQGGQTRCFERLPARHSAVKYSNLERSPSAAKRARRPKGASRAGGAGSRPQGRRPGRAVTVFLRNAVSGTVYYVVHRSKQRRRLPRFMPAWFPMQTHSVQR